MTKHLLSLSILSISITSAGCSSIHVASLASIAITGKGFGDHALSMVTGDDCSTLNLIHEERICDNMHSTEMVLLTSNQQIDDRFIALPNELANAFLVIGSFTEQTNAKKYLSNYPQWNGRVVAAEQTKFRVALGPLESDQVEPMKLTLAEHGIESAWLMRL